MDNKQEILEFIRSNHLGVISTINQKGSPEAAVMGVGQTDDLELIFGTYNSSRKYTNLKTNHNVAWAIGWDGPKTVQYEGVARELSGTEAEKYANAYHEKNPQAESYRDHPEERYFLVTPKLIRLTDMKTNPWRIIEIQF